MARNSIGKWDGGYIRKEKDGTTTYIIRKRVWGNLYEVSTRCTSSAAAEKQWKIFQEDPEGYVRARGDSSGNELPLTEELILEFLRWSEDVKKNSPNHVADQRREMSRWLAKLGPVNLRRLQLDDVTKHLTPAGERLQIKVIKVFFTYLVKHCRPALVARHPLRDLAVPASKPAQGRRRKSFPAEEYLRVRPKLPQRWRDICDVMAGTSWHISETNRFARNGEVEKVSGHGWVLTCPKRKDDTQRRTPVSATVAAAARRLREAGPFNRQWLLLELKKVTQVIKPGSFRHAVATHAINSGEDAAAVANFTGHDANIATLKRYYATFAIPKKVKTLV